MKKPSIPMAFSRAILALVTASLALASTAWGQATEKKLINLEIQTRLPSGVTFDAKGHLFGTSYGSTGGTLKERGVVFELIESRKGKWSKTAIYTFKGSQDGGGPLSTPIFDNAGNLYGTTFYGGTSNYGVVFELSPIPLSKNRWSETILWSFHGKSDGSGPSAGLTFDGTNLYGTTAYGGAYGNGTVFELSPGQNGNWSERVLYSFAGASDGANPVASLIFDGGGNLYGTTRAGGSSGDGTVFALIPGPNESWTENLLHSFTGSPEGDGASPLGSLVFDKSGSLFGTTIYGGTQNGGIVFQLTPGTGGAWTENVLHSFCITISCDDGFNPAAGLTFDSVGNFYGTTLDNDTYGNGGAVVEFSPDGNGGWTESLLYQFTGGDDGLWPRANVTLDGAGNLYSTTQNGGQWPGVTGFGVVFEIVLH